VLVLVSLFFPLSFCKAKKKAWQRKSFFKGSVSNYKISLKIKKYELHGPFTQKKNKKSRGQ